MVRDGDTGLPRKIELSLVGDDQGFFTLETIGHDKSGVLSAMLKTADDVIIDREAEVRLNFYLLTLFFFILHLFPIFPILLPRPFHIVDNVRKLLPCFKLEEIVLSHAVKHPRKLAKKSGILFARLVAQDVFLVTQQERNGFQAFHANFSQFFL